MGSEITIPAWLPGSDSCVLHVVTGLWCPLCGGTRATVALLHGHLREALGWNPLVVAGQVLAVLVALRWLLRRRAGGGPALSRREGRVLLAVLVVFTVGRNLPLLQPVLADLLGPVHLPLTLSPQQ